jgi:hypothetical protein
MRVYPVLHTKDEWHNEYSFTSGEGAKGQLAGSKWEWFKVPTESYSFVLFRSESNQGERD